VSDPSLSTLVIADGGLPSLLAAAIEAERRLVGGGGVLLMPWATAEPAATDQAVAVASIARFLRHDVAEPCLAPPDVGDALPPGMRDSMCLLTALHTARLAGCERVVWPIQYHNDDSSIGGDLDRIAAAVDRAQLIGRLALLESPRSGSDAVRIDAPLVDLTDAQIADLAVDVDAPVYLAWWWRTLADRRAEALAAAERRAWLPALRDAGWIDAAPASRPAILTAAPTPEPIAE
jgi:hypothetical protein